MLAVVLSGFLNGCGDDSAPMPTATSTPTASPTHTPTATPTPSLTATATALRTASVTPSVTPTCFFPPRPTPTVSFTLDPDTPKVGDTVQVSAFVSTGNAGPPESCTVSGTSPVFEDVRITACAGGLGGGTVTFEMKAVQPGSATVRLGFSFEIVDEICDPLNPFYEFVQGSATLVVTVGPSGTPTGTPTVTPTANPTARFVALLR